MLKRFRNWLCPPVPSALPILTEIDRLNLCVTSYVYGGKGTCSNRTWSVTVTEEWTGFKLKVEGEGRTFDEALAAAWIKYPRQGRA
jgi:hypothetical protein